MAALPQAALQVITDIQNALTRCNWMQGSINRFTNPHEEGVTTMDLFECLTLRNNGADFKSLFARFEKAPNRAPINPPRQVTIKAFRLWCYYKRARGEYPDPNLWAPTPAELTQWVDYWNHYGTEVAVPIDTPIPEYTRNTIWDVWSAALKNNIQPRLSKLTFVSFLYLVRDKDAPDAADLAATYRNISDDLVATTLHTGLQYDADNAQLWQLIWTSVSMTDGNSMRNLLLEFQDSRDGRGAYLKLKTMSQGTDTSPERWRAADDEMKNLSWDNSNKKYDIKAHISKTHAVHSVMAQNGEQATEANRMFYFLRSIKAGNDVALITFKTQMERETINGQISTFEALCAAFIQHMERNPGTPRSGGGYQHPRRGGRDSGRGGRGGRGGRSGGRGNDSGRGQSGGKAPHGRLTNTNIAEQMAQYSTKDWTSIKANNDFDEIMKWRAEYRAEQRARDAPKAGEKRKASAVAIEYDPDDWKVDEHEHGSKVYGPNYPPEDTSDPKMAKYQPQAEDNRKSAAARTRGSSFDEYKRAQNQSQNFFPAVEFNSGAGLKGPPLVAPPYVATSPGYTHQDDDCQFGRKANRSNDPKVSWGAPAPAPATGWGSYADRRISTVEINRDNSVMTPITIDTEDSKPAAKEVVAVPEPDANPAASIAKVVVAVPEPDANPAVDMEIENEPVKTAPTEVWPTADELFPDSSPEPEREPPDPKQDATDVRKILAGHHGMDPHADNSVPGHDMPNAHQEPTTQPCPPEKVTEPHARTKAANRAKARVETADSATKKAKREAQAAAAAKLTPRTTRSKTSQM